MKLLISKIGPLERSFILPAKRVDGTNTSQNTDDHFRSYLGSPTLSLLFCKIRVNSVCPVHLPSMTAL